MKKVMLIIGAAVGGLGFLFCVVIPVAALAVGWGNVAVTPSPTPTKPAVAAERPRVVPHTPSASPKPSVTRTTVSPTPKPTKTKAPSKQERANTVISHTATVRNISLGDCLALAGWKINGSYPGIEKSWQMVYTNGKGSALTINVDLAKADALPWDNNAAYLLQVNGCSIRSRS